jgi:hypothetical protein
MTNSPGLEDSRKQFRESEANEAAAGIVSGSQAERIYAGLRKI